MSNATRNSKRLVRFGVGLVAAAAVLSATIAPGVLAQALQPLAQTQVIATSANQSHIAAMTAGQSTDFLTLTVSQTEGPYFKANSPERMSLVDDTTQGIIRTHRW